MKATTENRNRFPLLPTLVIGGIILLFLYHGFFPIVDATDAQTLPIRSVDELYDNAAYFQGRIARIEGRVVSSGYFLKVGFYILQDVYAPESTILVVTKAFPPDRGAVYQVVGKVKPGFKLDNAASITVAEAEIAS